jgi:hypothetical protein
MEVMKPFYAKPMTDVKVTHKPDIFLLSDSLATVNDVATVKMAGRTITMRNTTLVVRREGKWLVKAMAEAGWGEMARAEGSAGGAPPAGTQDTGTGAGGGAGVQEPAPTR